MSDASAATDTATSAEAPKARRRPAKTMGSPVLKVEVTADDIEGGKRRSSSHCMIAEALKKAYPGASKVAIDLQTIRCSDPAKGLRYTWLTPRICQVALIDFDDGVTPKEFAFSLRRAHVSRMSHASERRQQEDKETGAKRKVRVRMEQQHGGHSIPTRIEGKPPPLSKFANRREFGLKGFRR